MFGFGKPNIEKMKERKDVEGLIKALDYKKDQQIRRNSAQALGAIKDKRAVEPLIKILNDYDTCLQAADALGDIGDKRAVEPLIKILSDSDKDVRREGIMALGKIGDKRAVEPLIETLNDSDKIVRREGIMALGEIGDKRAVEPLIETLNDSDDYVCKTATEALGKIGIPAIESLIKTLSDSRSSRRKRAADGLKIIGWKPENDKLAIQYWIASCEYSRCVEIGTPAVEPLIKTLNDSNQNIRIGATRTLGDIGDKRAVEPLIKILNDSDSLVRPYAAEALGKIGDARAVEPLIKILNDSNKDISKEAAEALEKINDSSAVSALNVYKERVYNEIQKSKEIQEKAFNNNLLVNSLSRITLIDSRNLGNAGPGGTTFQTAIQKLNQEDNYGAERDFLNAINLGLDPLRQGYAYAEIGNIKLKQNDLDNAIRYFLKVFENGQVLYESADTASKYMSIISSEMGHVNEAQIFISIATQTTGKLGYRLSPEAEKRTRQLARENFARKK